MGFKSLALDFSDESFIPSAENVSVTWDGRRIVTIGKSQVDLNQLAKEVIWQSREPILDDLDVGSLKLRQNGIQIIRKINDVYDLTDPQIKTKNIFTQALAWFWDVLVRDELSAARLSFRASKAFSSAIIYHDEEFLLRLSKQT